MKNAVLTEDLERVRVIRLNRANALNAMNQAIITGIQDALKSAEEDENVAVCVLTGVCKWCWSRNWNDDARVLRHCVDG